MDYKTEDYTFYGLRNNLSEDSLMDRLLDTLAYVVGLKEIEPDEIANLKTANFVLGYLYDVEAQVLSGLELLDRQKIDQFPGGYLPQTPVMLAQEWSPISALLEHGFKPIILRREQTRWACASGVWDIASVIPYKELEQCHCDEDLFWHVLGKVIEKKNTNRFLVSIIAKPGWSYKHGDLKNINLDEAIRADRVIWQRKPKR